MHELIFYRTSANSKLTIMMLGRIVRFTVSSMCDKRCLLEWSFDTNKECHLLVTPSPLGALLSKVLSDFCSSLSLSSRRHSMSIMTWWAWWRVSLSHSPWWHVSLINNPTLSIPLQICLLEILHHLFPFQTQQVRWLSQSRPLWSILLLGLV